MILHAVPERRTHPRVAAPVELVLEWPGGKKSYHFTRDLSAGGLFAFAPEAPEPGTELQVDLLVGSHLTRLSARGVVVRSEMDPRVPEEARGFAIELVSLSAQRRLQLMDLVDALLEASRAGRLAPGESFLATPGVF